MKNSSKLIKNENLTIDKLVPAPPYEEGWNSDDPRYVAYMLLVYSYDGYKKYAGALEIFNVFKERFDATGQIPQNFDLLRMLLFVQERSNRNDGWYGESGKLFSDAIIESLKLKIIAKDFD